LERLIGQILDVMFGGGQAVVAILLIAIIGLVVDRKRMILEIRQREARTEKLIEDYYQSNMQVRQLLVSIRQMLEFR
jgi:hypothetical protein